MATMETGEASTEVSLGEFTKIPTGEFINSKSYTFEVDTFMLCLTIALGIIGVLGNLTACFVLRRIKSQKVNFLIGSQATIDLLASLILLADACLLHRKIYRIPTPQQPTLGYIFCAFLYWDTILFCVFAASTYNLVAISIERYIAVLYPFLYSASFTRRKAVVMGCIVWMSAPIMHITYAVTQSDYIDGDCGFRQQSPSNRALLGVLIFIWDVFIPCMIMGFCSTRICLVVVSQIKADHKLNSVPAKGNNAIKIRRSHNVTITFIAVVIAYVTCWATNQISFLQSNLGGFQHYGEPVYHFGNAMAILNSAINPFLYVICMREYRDKLKTLLCQKILCSS